MIFLTAFQVLLLAAFPTAAAWFFGTGALTAAFRFRDVRALRGSLVLLAGAFAGVILCGALAVLEIALGCPNPCSFL